VIDAEIRVFQQYPPKGDVRVAPIGALSNSRGFPPDLRRWLVRAEADVNRVTQEVVGRPGQIGDLGDELRLDPMNAGRTSGEPKRVLRGGGRLRGDVLRAKGSQATPQIGEHLHGHPSADAAGIDELAVVSVVAQQQRAEVRPRSFRVGPADDDELLAVQRFGFAP